MMRNTPFSGGGISFVCFFLEDELDVVRRFVLRRVFVEPPLLVDLLLRRTDVCVPRIGRFVRLRLLSALLRAVVRVCLFSVAINKLPLKGVSKLIMNIKNVLIAYADQRFKNRPHTLFF